MRDDWLTRDLSWEEHTGRDNAPILPEIYEIYNQYTVMYHLAGFDVGSLPVNISAKCTKRSVRCHGCGVLQDVETLRGSVAAHYI